VILIDHTRKVLALTSGIQQILGSALPELGPTRLDQLPAALSALAEEALAPGGPSANRIIQISGGCTWLRVNALAVDDGTGRRSVALVLSDWTPIRQAEQQMARLDRLANLGTLAAGMAHEVKNALVACKTFIDLLLEKNAEGELVEIVRREMGRIDSLVSRMLKFGGLGSGKQSVVHVHEILEHSLRLLEPQMEDKAITLMRALEAAPDLVLADDHELQQAFVNLLLNAVEAMGLKGTLTVTTRVEIGGEKTPSGNGRPQLCLSIEDTGAGVPDHVLSHLFEPFVTTKPSGTGLGLAITRQIVHQHRGTIRVRSQLGQGTTFTISLPAVGVNP